MTVDEISCPVCKNALLTIEPGTESLICPTCGKELDAYEIGLAEVRAFIRQVRMIDAIGRYRRLTGVDLKTAKDMITEMWHSGDW